MSEWAGCKWRWTCTREREMRKLREGEVDMVEGRGGGEIKLRSIPTGRVSDMQTHTHTRGWLIEDRDKDSVCVSCATKSRRVEHTGPSRLPPGRSTHIRSIIVPITWIYTNLSIFLFSWSSRSLALPLRLRDEIQIGGLMRLFKCARASLRVSINQLIESILLPTYDNIQLVCVCVHSANCAHHCTAQFVHCSMFNVCWLSA